MGSWVRETRRKWPQLIISRSKTNELSWSENQSRLGRRSGHDCRSCPPCISDRRFRSDYRLGLWEEKRDTETVATAAVALLIASYQCMWLNMLPDSRAAERTMCNIRDQWTEDKPRYMRPQTTTTTATAGKQQVGTLHNSGYVSRRKWIRNAPPSDISITPNKTTVPIAYGACDCDCDLGLVWYTQIRWVQFAVCSLRCLCLWRVTLIFRLSTQYAALFVHLLLLLAISSADAITITILCTQQLDAEWPLQTQTQQTKRATLHATSSNQLYAPELFVSWNADVAYFALRCFVLLAYFVLLFVLCAYVVCFI